MYRPFICGANTIRSFLQKYGGAFYVRKTFIVIFDATFGCYIQLDVYLEFLLLYSLVLLVHQRSSPPSSWIEIITYECINIYVAHVLGLYACVTTLMFLSRRIPAVNNDALKYA